MMNLKRKQQGIGLLELMLSLGLIAILLVMAIRFYQATRTSQQTAQTISDIQGIVAAGLVVLQNSQELKDFQADFNLDNLHKANLLPGSVKEPNPFGGKTTLGAVDSPVRGTIEMDKIPGMQCATIKSRLAGNVQEVECSTTTAGEEATLTVKFN